MGSFVPVLLTTLALVAPAADGNWPQFRGPGAMGIASNPRLPEEWSTTKNVAWSAAIPGRGWSCPIVWGNRVYLTSVKSEGQVEAAKKGLYFGGERAKPPTDKHHWLVMALDLDTGKVIWEKTVHEAVPTWGLHVKNTYASETPVTDGERIYAYFGNLGLFCLAMDGTVLWSKKWGPFKTRYAWGTAASPVLHGDRIYVQNDNDEDSFLVALDKRTGSELWRLQRDEKSNWSTPFVWENDLRTELITCGSNKVRSYDLDGKLLWELGGMSTIMIPTPYAHDGLLYLSSGYVLDKKKPLLAIKPGASGDVTLGDDAASNEFVAWSQKQAGPYNPSTLTYDGKVYVLYDRGFFACYDAKTGAEVYSKKRFDNNANAFTASPWAYNGKIFCLSEDGDTFVVQAGPEFKVLGKNSLDETCLATPAIAGDRLLIRTDSRLYCIRRQ